MAPLVSPLKQIANKGSNVIFTCDRPHHALEPDRYQWYKQKQHKSKINQSSDVSLIDINAHGQILKLNKLNLNDSGWYLCCILYSAGSLSAQLIQKRFIKNNVNISGDNYYYYYDQTEASNHKINNNLINNPICSSSELIINNSQSANDNYQLKHHFFKILIVYISIFIFIISVIFILLFLNYRILKNNNGALNYANINNFERYRLSFHKDNETINISNSKLNTRYNLHP